MYYKNLKRLSKGNMRSPNSSKIIYTHNILYGHKVMCPPPLFLIQLLDSPWPKYPLCLSCVRSRRILKNILQDKVALQTIIHLYSHRKYLFTLQPHSYTYISFEFFLICFILNNIKYTYILYINTLII